MALAGARSVNEHVNISNISLRTERGWLVVAVRIGDTEHDVILEPWPYDEATEGSICHSVTGLGMKAIAAGLKT